MYHLAVVKSWISGWSFSVELFSFMDMTPTDNKLPDPISPET
ncbi:rCG46105 [Rattus norvegicus]|uniref:RCG46105 n=1 Tax=Rattus norvegicus TaxID=10116 RepID=A6ICR9_RAT|nr:rCG46105 [Rattus norvegicus]